MRYGNNRIVTAVHSVNGAPGGLVIVPAGTPRQLTLDVEVTIDKSNLSRLAREFA